ncbi:MAG: protein rep, partial [Cyanobacteria bacterium P01_C01_bin.38]
MRLKRFEYTRFSGRSHSLSTRDEALKIIERVTFSFGDCSVEDSELSDKLIKSFFKSLVDSVYFDSPETLSSAFSLLIKKRNSLLSKKHTYLSDVSPKDKPWDLHRRSAELVASIYQSADYQRYSERISNCSSLLEFALVADDKELFFKLRSAHFCRHRHCTVCQWRRTLMWTARFLKAMPKIQQDYPTHRYIFLTLTVRNCPLDELRSTISWMNKSWERMTHRKSFPGVGFVKSVEVTRNKKDNTAHPHFHVLIMVPSGYFGSRGGYLSKDKWINLWRSCLRADYDPSINVQVVKNDKDESSITGALREVLKYTVKPSDLIEDADWL